MERNIIKHVEQARAFLHTHLQRDLKSNEICQLEELFWHESKNGGFYHGLFELICNAWLFGFEAGRRAGKDDSKR